MAAKSQPQKLSTTYYDLPTPEPDLLKPLRFSTLCATVEKSSIQSQYGGIPLAGMYYVGVATHRIDITDPMLLRPLIRPTKTTLVLPKS